MTSWHLSWSGKCPVGKFSSVEKTYTGGKCQGRAICLWWQLSYSYLKLKKNCLLMWSEQKMLLLALRKLYFHFLSHLLGYDRGDTVFLSIFWTKSNSIWFRKSKGKLSPRSYRIQCERKWNTSFVSAGFWNIFTRRPRGVRLFGYDRGRP